MCQGRQERSTAHDRGVDLAEVAPWHLEVPTHDPSPLSPVDLPDLVPLPLTKHLEGQHVHAFGKPGELEDTALPEGVHLLLHCYVEQVPVRLLPGLGNGHLVLVGAAVCRVGGPFSLFVRRVRRSALSDVILPAAAFVAGVRNGRRCVLGTVALARCSGYASGLCCFNDVVGHPCAQSCGR